MKNRVLILVGIAIISVVSVGGYALAQDTKSVRLGNLAPDAISGESSVRWNIDHCGNSEEMIEIMKENGFEDMAKWMEEGNYEAMKEFMNNLSDEDYKKMIDLMNQNDYVGMSRMMESFGKEGMIKMHNSMMGNMMNRFQR
ncbi:hypothetical protein NE686_21905 [Tissierella carlieri]|uniref:DUF2680 domain-containing protein n=1 Tax=Tissierella carlieri TaxID=689904 RepID=A0ABT1SHB0_9FIRM|nr:hypothetical protein [Tissierella carlieri]MCQ4925762.1 hypothetical protein [Tissierella carlieri]